MALTRAPRRTCLLLTAFLLVLVACAGGTVRPAGQPAPTSSDGGSTSTASTGTTTTETTTTIALPFKRTDADAKLATLLLPARAFGAGFEVSEASAGINFDGAYCPGHPFPNRPTAEASLNLQTPATNDSSFAGETVAHFEPAVAHSLIAAFEALNAACATAGATGNSALTFTPLVGVGDQAVRGVPAAGSHGGSFDLVLVRSADLIILLVGLGPQRVITQAVVLAAVNKVKAG